MTSVRVRSRLIAAIFVPLLVLIAGSWQFVDEHRSDVRRVEGVLERLDRLALLTELRSSLYAERLAAEILVPSRRLDAAMLATTTFGLTLVQDPDSLEARTDAALAAVDPQDRPFPQSELDQVRSDRAEWADTIRGISERLAPFYDRTIAAMMQLADEVRTASVESGDRGLVMAGTTFQRSIALPGAAAETLRSISDLFLAEPAQRPTLQSETAAAAATLSELSNRYAVSLVEWQGDVAQIENSSPRPPSALLDALRAASAGDLTTPDRAALEPASIGLTLIEGIDWLVRVDQIPSRAASSMRETAAVVVEGERGAAQRAALGAFVVTASSLLAAVALARSIVVPVRRLTDRARQLGAGDLDGRALPLTGPSDVVAASAALNDVADNLSLVKRKATALADGLLSDPALQEPLPGPLGAELERSAQQLTTNLVEWQEFRSQLMYDASHDSLTGVANRQSVLSALERFSSRDGRTRTAVIFVDLNRFKSVNDRHGHAGGDQLLRVVAHRLVACTPELGLVGRWGGDEFVIVLPDATGDQAHALAEVMMGSLAEPTSINGSRTCITASAGVAVFGQTTITDTSWSDDLIRQADLAVYHAKSLGPGSVALFDEVLGQHIREQDQIGSALTAALNDTAHELFLVFQPIVDAKTGCLNGMEALVRWQRPEGLLRPDEFIPIAERSDLIVQLDEWVLRSALRQLDEWTGEDLFADTVLSVNISARSLRDSLFADRVSAALAECSIEPRRLMLEITETALITDIEFASAQLRHLRAHGVLIAIDDFGTGFTSVAQLRDLPVDELKIDQSFVQGLDTGDNLVLVRMISDLAQHLKIPTVAEGIETAEQCELMTQIGCTALQGYFFARPLLPADFARRASSGTWLSAASKSER